MLVSRLHELLSESQQVLEGGGGLGMTLLLDVLTLDGPGDGRPGPHGGRCARHLVGEGHGNVAQHRPGGNGGHLARLLDLLGIQLIHELLNKVPAMVVLHGGEDLHAVLLQGS